MCHLDNQSRTMLRVPLKSHRVRDSYYKYGTKKDCLIINKKMKMDRTLFSTASKTSFVLIPNEIMWKWRLITYVK